MRGLGKTEALTGEDAAALFAAHLPEGRNDPIILAVSGGPDSTAMMGLYAEAQRILSLPPALVATVDHRLRREARAEAEAVAHLAATFGFAHRLLAWEDRTRLSRLQEDARNARYRLIGQLVRETGAVAVLTAHTLNDQAETVVMRLARGSGPAGLQGILPQRVLRGVQLVRPFLTVPKSRLLATCKVRGWPYATDPSNANPDFQRVRIRGLMAALTREGLTAERLGLFARRMGRAQAALDAAAARVAADIRFAVRGKTAFDAVRLVEEPEEIILLVLRRLIDEVSEAYGEEGIVRLNALEALVARLVPQVRQTRRFDGTIGTVLIRVREGSLTVGLAPPRKR